MSWTVYTRPEDPVPSLDEVKAHLRAADFDDDDDDIESKIWGAITEFEDPNLGFLGTSILPREIEISLDSFPTCIPLPCGPVLNDGSEYKVSIEYDDPDGDDQEVAASVYRVVDPDNSNRRIVLRSGQSWPQAGVGDGVVRVYYWAGYDPEDTRVNNFKTAVKLHVQMTYDGETETDRNLPDTIKRLLQPYRSMHV